MARCPCGWIAPPPYTLAHHLTTPTHLTLLAARHAWENGDPRR